MLNTPALPPGKQVAPRDAKDAMSSRVLDSPIDLEGRESPERLVFEADRLFVLGGAEQFQNRRGWLLEGVRGARLQPALGSCFLQLRLEDQWVDAFRYPGAADRYLTDLVDALNERCQEGHDLSLQPERGAAAALTSGASVQRWHTTRRILALLGPFRPGILLLLVLSAVAVAIDVAPPMLQRVLVDRVLEPRVPRSAVAQPLLMLLAIVSGLLMFRLAGTAVAIWKGVVSSRIGTTLTASLRNRLVEKLNELPLAFHNGQQVGMLMSRVAYDTETMHTLVYQITGGFLLQSLQLAGIGVMLFWLNPRLALVTMLPMPLILAGSWYFTRYLNPRNNHYWEAVGKQATSLMGMLSGIRVVKAFVQEQREVERFQEVSRRLRDSRQTVDFSTSTFSALMGFVFGLGGLAVWYLGGRDVLGQTMSLGSLMAFLAYLAMFYTPLTTIAESTTWLSSFFITCARVFELLDRPGPREDPDARKVADIQGRIEFRDVSFAYDIARPVLRNVSFTIEPGEMIGIVGRSGSGKSTLVSLIARLYDIGSGQIRVDGMDANQLNRRSLRRRIGMVPQEPFLFRGAVADNIAYGVPDARPEQIITAAKLADAHEFILRQPLAYETQLGEGGTGLSGGERQRLSIARALLFDPAILILDEATASIDAESERAICDAIRRFARRRTTIVIAHRLSTLRDANRLLVFDQGRLIEQGTPAELLAQDGLYAALARIQWNLSQGGRHMASGSGLRVAEAGGNPLDATDGPHPDVLFSAVGGNGSRPRTAAAGDRCEVNWLPPDVHVSAQGQGQLRLEWGPRNVADLHAVRAFPASHPEQLISLRGCDRWGAETEVGMIRNLAACSETTQQAVRGSLARRYLLRPIREVRQIRSNGQSLLLRVVMASGPARIELEQHGQSVQSFGRHGVLLIDRQGSHYVIADRGTLPRRQQRLLALYFSD
jgi:ATP-binding cassette subfamily B protein